MGLIRDLQEMRKELETKDKEIERLNIEKEQLNSRIWETKDMIRILETNCDISDYHAQKLIQILNNFEGVNKE